MNRSKKAIIVAGQSNTHTAKEFGVAPVITGPLDLGIKHLGRNESNLTPLPSGVSNIHFQQNNGVLTSYAYPLAKKIKDTLQCEELLIIPCAIGGTGWSTNNWSANGNLYKDLVARTRYAIEVLDCEIVGFFWSQGESDSNATIAPVYSYLLDSLAMTIRDVAQVAGQTSGSIIPFVTFDMVNDWIGEDAHRILVQKALENIGDRIPFAANIDTSTLPVDIDRDIIHYDTRQILEIGNRMFDAWKIARCKTKKALKPEKGTYLLHTLTNDVWYATKWEALYYGEDSTAEQYSRLGDVWKYKQDNTYTFRLEYDVLEGEILTTKSMTFEQAFIPFMFEPKDSPASLLDMTPDVQYGGEDSSGFPGLYYRAQEDALLGFSGGGTWYLPCGQTNSWNGGIPVASIGGKNIIANQLRLYAIVS